MRPLLFGDPLDPRMQDVKADMEAQGLRPVFRAPHHFKPSEIEPASLVVVGEEQKSAQSIALAYAGKDVRILPVLPVGGDESLEKDVLVARAVELGVGNQSTLTRWGVKRLTDAIAEAEQG